MHYRHTTLLRRPYKLKEMHLVSHLPSGCGMKLVLLAVCLAAAPCVQAGNGDEASSVDLNVNSRYTVESIDFSTHEKYQVSQSVADQMKRLVGEHLNIDALNSLSQRINDELRARTVTFRVSRGTEQASVRVTFEVERRQSRFDVALSNLSYNSREGWTGTGRATLTAGADALTMTGLSNGDDLVERYSGIRLRYDRLGLVNNRLRLGFEFDTFREQYDGQTYASALGAGTYRSRTNIEPSATFTLSKPLTLTVGLSFEKLTPDDGTVRSEAANTVVTTLRYHNRSEVAEATSREVDAIYRLRAATAGLGSDSSYVRHSVQAKYSWRHERHLAEVAVTAGMIYGRAPLFERFVLGNNSTLRGWNKYELDPMGGNRLAHASVTYGYQIMRVFYDTGAIWDQGRKPEEKHSAGIGVNTGLGLLGKNTLLIAVAFPIRQGHMEPLLLAGMNF